MSEKRDEALERAKMLEEAVGTAEIDPEQENVAELRPPPTPPQRVDEGGVAQRMRAYREAAGDRNIKAFINVGSGTVSVGTRVGKKTFRIGVNRKHPKALGDIPSVMGDFVKADVPAIHFIHMISIAQEFGLPIAPITPPEVGEGAVFQRREPNRWLAGFVFLAILLALLAAGQTGPSPKATTTKSS